MGSDLRKRGRSGEKIDSKGDAEALYHWKENIMKGFVPTAAFAVLLSGCVTTPPTQAAIDSCRQMESEMGLNQRHDHGEFKNRGINPMNLSHARCVAILGDS